SSMFLDTNRYVTERARPTYNYGFLLDYLNRITYKYADGILIQTKLAQDVIYKKTKHSNISVVGNPIRRFEVCGIKREKIIFNVGRLARSKNQNLLLS